MKPTLPLDRRGMTLIELLVGMTVTLLIVTASMVFVQQQAQALTLGRDQMRTLQNYRFALSTLRREHTAPCILQAGDQQLNLIGRDGARADRIAQRIERDHVGGATRAQQLVQHFL